MSKPLIITACAAITPYGLNTHDFANGYQQRDLDFSANTELAKYITDDNVQAAMLPEYDVKKLLNMRGAGQLDSLTKHLCVAAKEMEVQLGFDSVEMRQEKIKDERLSIVIGSTGPVQSVMNFDEAAVEEPQYVAPGAFPNVVFNVPACYASIRHAARASVITLTDGDTSSANAIKVAMRQLENDRVDMAWAGGAEELTPAQVLLLKAQDNFIDLETLPPLSEGVYLFALTSQDKAETLGTPSLAEVYEVVTLFNPNVEQGTKQLIERLAELHPEKMKEVTWVVSNVAKDTDMLPYACKLYQTNETLGCLAAASSAAAIMATLADPKVLPGEHLLHICHDECGASAAILYHKTNHLT